VDERMTHFFKFHAIAMNCQPAKNSVTRFLEYIFFSNYFYGICAVGLSIEATLQQKIPNKSFAYFVLIFLVTVLYYAYPYIRKSLSQTNNPRTNWYTRNYNLMRWNQIAITVILLSSALLFLKQYERTLTHLPINKWLLLLIFPVVAGSYYGLNFLFGNYNLRKIGWLKPFVIGFTWAGLVTIYPVVFYDITNDLEYQFSWVGELLFLKNFMFVSLLCIMFDIKDYSADYIARLKTFVVKLGLRKTISYLLLPLSVVGLVSFVFMPRQINFASPKFC